MPWGWHTDSRSSDRYTDIRLSAMPYMRPNAPRTDDPSDPGRDSRGYVYARSYGHSGHKLLYSVFLSRGLELVRD